MTQQLFAGKHKDHSASEKVHDAEIDRLRRHKNDGYSGDGKTYDIQKYSAAESAFFTVSPHESGNNDEGAGDEFLPQINERLTVPGRIVAEDGIDVVHQMKQHHVDDNKSPERINTVKSFFDTAHSL